jgi:phage terminase small subunit
MEDERFEECRQLSEEYGIPLQTVVRLADILGLEPSARDRLRRACSEAASPEYPDFTDGVVNGK